MFCTRGVQRQFAKLANHTRRTITTIVTVTLLGTGLAAAEDSSVPQFSPEAAGPSTAIATHDYIIGPLDKLGIRVFQVKDLSLDGVQVDASGAIDLPLIGSVAAKGKTTSQLSKEIATLLSEKYLQSPQVSVVVEDSASQKFTVDGEVKNPGVFKMVGPTTLAQAVAMAGGPSEVADLHEVAVVRVIGGVRKAAICDYAEIRSGKAPDPMLQGGDEIVMNSSDMKSTWQTVLKAMPLFAFLNFVP
jgi:polysaccharide biosynthesis/export protein